MRKREIFWIVVMLLTAWGYVHFFSNWGMKKGITIMPSLRPPGTFGGRSGNGSVFPVVFKLDNEYRLTSLKAVEVDTNKVKGPEHVLWHLVATNGSDPVQLFLYGQNIKGMTPYLRGVGPEPLSNNVPYRLEITAGELKGSAPFHTELAPTR
jgi:hypothetical protein